MVRLAAAVAASLLLPLPAPAQESDIAAAVKATYLYKFAPFIRWPDAASEFPGDVFPLCVIGGRNGFAAVLARAVQGQTIDGHPVVERDVASAPAAGCAVVYIDASSAGAEAVISAMHDKPVLTVTDTGDGSGPKGIINFIIRDNRVRFEIDEAAATAAGLSISSKLLALAVSFHTNSSR